MRTNALLPLHDSYLNRANIGITHVLNKTKHVIRWCTPSIDNKSSRVINPYKSDISVSYESLGFPSEPSGIFKKAYSRAARIYGADHTLFSVSGSTWSNFIVLRALSKQIPNLRILAQRNVHKSIIPPCEDYVINLMFLPPQVDKKLQIFLPNSVDEIIETIKKTTPQVLLITNPTYEGFVIDLTALVKKVRKSYPKLIIFIDEAWGSHLHFSKKLPLSAMEAGADICIQSTHKQGGALQQTGMIHWKDGRIDSNFILDSYRSLMTTSPSFTLLASLDAAAEMMEKRGMQIIDRILYLAEILTKEINLIPGFKVINTRNLHKRNKSVFDKDETKIFVEVTGTGMTGYQIANILEKKYMIIVEKYNAHSLLFIVPFQATIKDIDVTTAALTSIVKNTMHKTKFKSFDIDMPKNISKIFELGDVAKLLPNQFEKIPLEKAIGRISAENIIPYPPGIPTTIKGEEFTSEIINYYNALKQYSNVHIFANDQTMDTVLVVK